MKEQLVSFELATMAEEKGFNIKTLSFYTKSGHIMNNNIGKLYSYDASSKNPSFGMSSDEVIAAPTQSMLAEWLRKNHKIEVYVQTEFVGALYQYVIKWHDLAHIEQYGNGDKNYEVAMEKGLIEALKKIK